MTKFLLIGLSLTLFVISSCEDSSEGGVPAYYDFYFNIKHSERNIFNANESYTAKNLKLTTNYFDGFSPVGGSFFVKDSLFGIYEAASSERDLDGGAFDKTIILDFDNGDYDTIVIDRTHSTYDILYNNRLVESYDLGNLEFSVDFFKSNGYGRPSQVKNPMIIEVEKRIIVE